jgi:hypothetical protein
VFVAVALIVAMLAACLVPLVWAPRLFIDAAPKHREARTNLRGAFFAERSWSVEHDGGFVESLERVGFMPEFGNRYAYFLAPFVDPLDREHPDGGQRHTTIPPDWRRYHPSPGLGVLLAALPPSVIAELGVNADGGMTIAAAGNLDGDATIDVWTVALHDRVIDGGVVPAGVPFRHVDDDAH